MITGRRFAAIDIGSNAVRLLLSEVFENKIIKMAQCTDGRTITDGKIKEVRDHLKFFSYDDRITKLGLKPDRADVIMPALKIYMSVMKWGGVQSMAVPQIDLEDGMVRIMHREHIHSRKRQKQDPARKQSAPAPEKTEQP